MADADDGERCLGGGMVGAGWRGEGPDAAGTAHEHHLAHGEGKGRGAGLGHVGNAAGKGGAGDAGDRAAVDLDPASLGRQQTEEGAEERGLAAAVRAEQAEDLARDDLGLTPAPTGARRWPKARSRAASISASPAGR